MITRKTRPASHMMCPRGSARGQGPDTERFATPDCYVVTLSSPSR
jgi:hypothetical protein